MSLQPIHYFVSDLLQTKFDVDQVTAGSYFGAISVVSGMSLPFVGMFVDKFGHLSTLMIFANILGLASNLIWVFMSNDCLHTEAGCSSQVAVAIFLMGIANGFFVGTAWNAMAYVVPRNKVGTAYGTAGSVLGLMNSIGPVLLGWIHDKTMDVGYGYYYVTVFASWLSTVAVLSAMLLYVVDIKKNEARLRINVKQRRALNRRT